MYSPIRIEAPAQVELPWGLQWDDLRGAIPELRLPLGVFRTHEIRGLHQSGRSQILLLRYEDRDGRQQARTIFLKLGNPARPEVAKYRYLLERGAPVSPPLGTATTAAGEIMIFPFLPTIGTTAEEADDLLGLVAEINSIRDPAAELFRPPQGTPGYGERIREVLIDFLPTAEEARRWFDAYQEAIVAADAIPLALNHNELSFQQVGWLDQGPGDRRRLVVFDLETMSLRPLYTDLAGMLPSLANQTGRTEDDLFRSYLAKLAHRTDETTDQRLAWSRMRTLRIIRTFESLPWLITMAGTIGIETPQHAIARLAGDLGDSRLGSF
ncbi:hypothetical protein [Microlunatus parietis]|uniref:Aminoglycoside phosphotransferase domain-containing protein n=1 Tax=Microlunatus parietis TaxID=682979 RepID=A0A7Y9L9E1_9ACTN|nr:hypothetical protein [Microlunatus parietis]NYE68698.1 hypothetical protein [Microlunatus parietis]